MGAGDFLNIVIHVSLANRLARYVILKLAYSCEYGRKYEPYLGYGYPICVE
jgi:hypothetical protein